VNRFVLDLGDHQVQLAPGVWRIGRDPECEIILTDEAVSRRHATLRVAKDGVELIDHGSRNGVRVNGERMYGTKALAPGDRIKIGAAELRLTDREAVDVARVAAATKPLQRPRTAPVDTGLLHLSAREREVFERLAKGETQREIAETLGLSVKTVETYRARIGEKLGLKTRADLVRYALRVGVLRPE